MNTATLNTLDQPAAAPHANPQGAHRLRVASKVVGTLWLVAGFLLLVFWATHPQPTGWDGLGHVIVTAITLLGMMIAGGVGMLLELLRFRPCRADGHDVLLGMLAHATPMLITAGLYLAAVLLNW